VGKLSYSLYLYHWPIIVALEFSTGGLTPTIGTLGVVLSFVPAYLSFRFVETPFRTARRFVEPPARGLRYGLGLTAVGVLSGLSILAFIGINERSELVAATSEIGAASNDSDGNVDDPVGGLDVIEPLIEIDLPDQLPAATIPPLTSVADDNPSVYDEGCHQNHARSDPIACEYGTAGGPMVVLVGDSQAAQWVPAFEAIVARAGWHFYSFSKSACPFGLMLMGVRGEPYDACMEWNRNVIDLLVDEMRPDLVISTSSNSNLPMNPDGTIPDTDQRLDLYRRGLTEAVEELTAAGIQVALLADTPRPRFDIPECLASEVSVAACSVAREEANTYSLQGDVAEALGIPYADMADFICTPTVCPAVIENVIVWRDTNHMTATYARSLAGALMQALPDV
ncbi:MAG: acyltransferase family protein, partial [Acidimicrobiia bacterium]